MSATLEEKYHRALIRIAQAVGDSDMSSMNRLALIEYLAQDALGILMKATCKVCYQVTDGSEYCDMHRPA